MNGLIQLLSSYGVSQGAIIKAAFYLVAGLTLSSALLVVLSRNIFHSAVYLAATLIGIACVYLYLDAEFLAVVQVLIYVGAIVTLFIFTIMLTADIVTDSLRGMPLRVLTSAFASLAIYFILVRAAVMTAPQTGLPAAAQSGLPELGRSLMTKYALPFEVISLISLASLVGAIVMGKSEKR